MVACREVTNTSAFPPRCHDGTPLFPSRTFPASRDHRVFQALEADVRWLAMDMWEAALAASHELRRGGDLDPDLVRQILQGGSGAMFQICPGCRVLTQRSEGCNHMT